MKATRSAKPADRTVVVVEDDMALLNSLKFSLEIEGFNVLGYVSGEATLAADGWQDAACLVIDYALPDTDGWELLDVMRSMGSAAPAILITTHPSASLSARAAAAGVPIIEKPLLGNALTEAIGAAINET
jgi:FixJ family two-component response regulator